MKIFLKLICFLLFILMILYVIGFVYIVIKGTSAPEGLQILYGWFLNFYQH